MIQYVLFKNISSYKNSPEMNLNPLVVEDHKATYIVPLDVKIVQIPRSDGGC